MNALKHHDSIRRSLSRGTITPSLTVKPDSDVPYVSPGADQLASVQCSATRELSPSMEQLFWHIRSNVKSLHNVVTEPEEMDDQTVAIVDHTLTLIENFRAELISKNSIQNL